MTTGSGNVDTALTEAINRTEGHISRADTKAGQLMTVTGLLTTVGTVIAPDSHGIPLAMLVIAALTGAASFALSLWVLMPRFGARGCAPDRNSFVYWATASSDDIRAGLAEDRRADSIRVLSAIALRKMQLLRHAGFAAFAAVAALALAGLTR